jgi:hypothetical protein
MVIRSFLSFKEKRRNLIFMAVNKPLIFPGISVGPNNFDVYINLLKAKVNLSSIP